MTAELKVPCILSGADLAPKASLQ